MELTQAHRDALNDVLTWRRDVRHFSSEPVSADVLDRLRAAMELAPSVGNARPWRVLHVTTPALRAAVIANGAHLFGGGMPVQRDNDRSGLRRCAHDLKLGQIVAHDQGNRDVRTCAHRNQCRRALCCAYFKVGARGAMIIVCHIYICQWVAPNRCGLLVQSFPIAVAWQWTATFQPQVK